MFGASGGIGRALCEGLTEGGCEMVYAGSRAGEEPSGGPYRPFTFDLTREDTIKEAADAMKDDPPEWVIVASGVLTLSDGTGPERSYRHVEPASMAEVFALNTIGPALVAKHCLRLMPRKERFVFAALSARVGSITDNGIGGWHAYRASKAALNMLLKNYAIELGRTHEAAVVVGLHPGTVDTALSEPFQKNLPEGQLTEPGEAAGNLLGLLAGLGPEDSGKIFDYAGKVVPA